MDGMVSYGAQGCSDKGVPCNPGAPGHAATDATEALAVQLQVI